MEARIRRRGKETDVPGLVVRFGGRSLGIEIEKEMKEQGELQG
jgi:hypothetical protein